MPPVPSEPSESRIETIAVIGLGYVGLPLSLQFARKGVSVIGLDIDQAKVDAINRGESYIKHISAADIAEQVRAGRFRASTDFSLIAGRAAMPPGHQLSVIGSQGKSASNSTDFPNNQELITDNPARSVAAVIICVPTPLNKYREPDRACASSAKWGR